MKCFLLLLFFPLLFGGGSVMALSNPPVSNAGGILPGPVSANAGQDYVKTTLLPKITSGFLTVLLAISVIMIILAGFFYIFSSGNTELKDKAKNTIFWVVVGVVIAVLSLAIVKFVIGINFSGT